ncbi:Tol-Pal system beta propeller repeat protein TolB [Mangrovicoccus algicola]|uniref:Tol-Pal system protein TolB n=1 Tax=Mangrovicoccus algicola TaxID=2771008 RepID=A0A8J6YVL0_9RHOB|nr:Tol-Pal system beta propeller repeat protein TolB [Mangrovicoccus algicola]MBE3638582.1 Tol-Pal system protein TolB [Mangrovicoccus algicola]
MRRLTTACLAALILAAPALTPALAQEARGPLRIEITDGVIEPVPIALSEFVTSSMQGQAMVQDMLGVIRNDLEGTGLFRAIGREAFISPVTNFDSPVAYADWKTINAQALVTGQLEHTGDQITVKFRLFDIFSEQQLGEGLQFSGRPDGWRRIAHKVADAIYSRITGEGPYFDSRVVYVAETGPKDARVKRLAIMDQDGANVKYLTDGRDLVIAPRISPDNTRVLYTSYSSGFPHIYEMNLNSLSVTAVDDQPGSMTFSPRYAPDGRAILFSFEQGGNTDLYRLDLGSGSRTRLSDAASIETAPSFSPDGRQIVFESDRSGAPQLYVMPAGGGEPKRISFGAGRYGTPVWSPKGDYIAFTKQNQGRFHIGVMRPDGSEERLLTAAFLDEAPTWAPNGRVLMFTRETPGSGGAAQIYSVDITGRNLQRVPTEGSGSDPAWSALMK